MDNFVTTAIVGTGQQSSPQAITGTEVDTLVAQLPELPIERTLLLSAGARAVYRLAGFRAAQAPETILVAPAERYPACSPEAAHILADMFRGQNGNLLPEALERLQSVQKRLPHTLLVEALTYGTKSSVVRERLVPVLGERGYWLGKFNPTWASWLNDFVQQAEPELPSHAETLWEFGTIGARVQVLQQLRTIDPARARQWLQDVWKKEKAEARLMLLEALRTHLSLEDEPFLEEALSDRSEPVRVLAASFLTQIPTTALSQRMRAYADTMLTYTEGKLVVTPPETFPKTWQRDGLTKKQPHRQIGERSWWLLQVLARVPLTHWEEHFALSPQQLVEALQVLGQEKDPWYENIREAWSDSAGRYPAPDWAIHLWNCWPTNDYDQWRLSLLGKMPPRETENLVLQLFKHMHIEQVKSYVLRDAIHAVPHRPWNVAFAQAFLAFLRQYALVDVVAINARMHTHAMRAIFQVAAQNIPPELFSAAVEPWDTIDSDEWFANELRSQITEFIDTIQMRKRVIEEIQ